MPRSDAVVRMLDGYRELMADFLDGSSSADEFEVRFLAYFKNDRSQIPGPEFDVLDGLFADVDEYVANDDLRAKVGGLDAGGLSDAVRSAYQQLYGG